MTYSFQRWHCGFRELKAVTLIPPRQTSAIIVKSDLVKEKKEALDEKDVPLAPMCVPEPHHSAN